MIFKIQYKVFIIELDKMNENESSWPVSNKLAGFFVLYGYANALGLVDVSHFISIILLYYLVEGSDLEVQCCTAIPRT